MGDWRVVLDDSVMCGGACDGTEDVFLTEPPDGLGGAPDLTTGDQSYPQRDGVAHFSDWYGPRILTMTGVIGSKTCAGCDPTPRQDAADFVKAWERRCDDVEIVFHVPCEGENTDANLLTNPSFDVNADHWEESSFTTKTRNTSVYQSEPASCRLVADEAGVTMSLVHEAFPVYAGHLYQGRGYVKAGGTGRTFHMAMLWLDVHGDEISIDYGPSQDDNADLWTAYTIFVEAPDGAVTAQMGILMTGAGADGDTHYFDTFSLIDRSLGDPVFGPFGVRGRPRVAQVKWRKGKKNIADVTARFDGNDQRIYILDQSGTPGSGGLCQTVADTPSYPEAADLFPALSGIDHLWQPRDAIPGTDPTTGLVPDADGATPATTQGPNGTPYSIGPSISHFIDHQSFASGTVLTTPLLWLGSLYGSGMIGWFHMPDGDPTLPTAVMFIDGTHWVGNGPDGIVPQAQWGGSAVNLDTNIANALGFNGANAGKLVSVMIAWRAGGSVDIICSVGEPYSNTYTTYTQTVASSGVLLDGDPAYISVMHGRGAAFVAGVGHYASTSAAQVVANDFADVGFRPSGGTIVLPNSGNVCVPLQISFSAVGDYPLEVWGGGSEYVGWFPTDGVPLYQGVRIDTETGTATNGPLDASTMITGDPFMVAQPGDTLYAYGGGDVTVCFRPAVLSA